MANIIISFFASVIDGNPENLYCFYESLSNDLREHGNHVLMINTVIFKRYNSSEITNENLKNHVLEKIKSFNPDLFISFNHQIFEEIPEIVECPIVIWDADCYDRFSNKKLFIANKDKYLVFAFSKGWIKDYDDLGFDKNKIFHIPAATSVKSENLVQDKNISFIGNKFGLHPDVKNYCGDHKLQDAWSDSINNQLFDFKSILKKHELSIDQENIPIDVLFDTRSVVLTTLIDLGLRLYGPKWDDFIDSMPQLAFCSERKQLYSLKHNQDLYNSSKIGLNINHPQTRGYSFSWRVFDIMASNACLVTNSASELREMTENHVEIPTYGSPYDARELCKALLKDDARRQDIVAASQKYVRENALWKHRFKDIEQITGVKLLNDTETTGRFCALTTPYSLFPAPAKPVPVDRYANRRKIMNFEFNLLKKYQFFMEFTKKKTKAKEGE